MAQAYRGVAQSLARFFIKSLGHPTLRGQPTFSNSPYHDLGISQPEKHDACYDDKGVHLCYFFAKVSKIVG